jgi:hypothetical protein
VLEQSPCQSRSRADGVFIFEVKPAPLRRFLNLHLPLDAPIALLVVFAMHKKSPGLHDYRAARGVRDENIRTFRRLKNGTVIAVSFSRRPVRIE